MDIQQLTMLEKINLTWLEKGGNLMIKYNNLSLLLINQYYRIQLLLPPNYDRKDFPY